MFLECTNPSRILRKAVRSEGKRRIATRILFPLGKVLLSEDTAPGPSTPYVPDNPALVEKQLLVFRTSRFLFGKKAIILVFKAQRRSVSGFELSSVKGEF